MNKNDLALINLHWLIFHKTKTKPNHIYLVYMYEGDLALNNLQWLICHASKLNKTNNYIKLEKKKDLI